MPKPRANVAGDNNERVRLSSHQHSQAPQHPPLSQSNRAFNPQKRPPPTAPPNPLCSANFARRPAPDRMLPQNLPKLDTAVPQQHQNQQRKPQARLIGRLDRAPPPKQPNVETRAVPRSARPEIGWATPTEGLSAMPKPLDVTKAKKGRSNGPPKGVPVRKPLPVGSGVKKAQMSKAKACPTLESTKGTMKESDGCCLMM